MRATHGGEVLSSRDLGGDLCGRKRSKYGRIALSEGGETRQTIGLSGQARAHVGRGRRVQLMEMQLLQEQIRDARGGLLGRRRSQDILP